MKIFNLPKVQLLKNSLDIYTKQHERIASNVANANNPDYKRLNTNFSQVLNDQSEGKLKGGNPGHITETHEVDRTRILDNEAGKEKVDLSLEMAELSENQIRFDFASRALARSYRALSASITGKTS